MRWLFSSLLLVPGVASGDPDDYDPLLDTPPASEGRGGEIYEPPDPRAPGFMVGGFLGGYLGSVHSFLTKERSTLTSGGRPFVGFGLGYRSRSLLEIGLDFGLGLGRTYAPKFDIEISAFDVIIQPRVVFHVLEHPAIGLYAGAAAEIILFDVEPAGLNQAGLGPSGIVGMLHRLGPHSLVFLDVSTTAFHDFLAFHFEDPSAEDLEEDPTLGPEKVHGAWYTIVRVTVGYRLTAF